MQQLSTEQLTRLKDDELLHHWYAAQTEAKDAKKVIEYEATVRRLCAGRFFPAPKEGTNRFGLQGGYDLKLVQTYDRKLDASVVAAFPRMREMGLPVETLFPMEPKLHLPTYRNIASDDTRHFVDGFIQTKPNAPQLEIVEAKKR